MSPCSSPSPCRQALFAKQFALRGSDDTTVLSSAGERQFLFALFNQINQVWKK
jgi:hypothetical protein